MGGFDAETFESGDSLILGAANVFPTTLNDWDSGEKISSAWADALEAKIGIDGSAVTTSLDYKINNLSTFTFVSGNPATTTLMLLQGGFISSASSSVTTLQGGSFFASSTLVVDGLSTLNNLTVTGTCTGCGGGAAFAWTPTAFGNATTTLLQFNAGFISLTSSSTVQNLQAKNLFASSTIVVDGLATFGSSGITVNGTNITDFAGTALTVTTGTLNCDTATAGAQGCLTGTDWTRFNNGVASSSIDTYAELNTLVADVTLTHNGLFDTFSELDAIVADKALFNLADNFTIAGQNLFTASTTFTSGISLPIGAGVSITQSGNIAIDSSAEGQLVYHDGTSVKVNLPYVSFKFWVSTTTLTGRGAYGTSGTTTIILDGWSYPVSFSTLACTTNPISGNGTSTVVIGKGATPNNSQFVVADDRPTSTAVTLTSNNTFAARERPRISIGTSIGTVDAISCDGLVLPIRQ